MARNPTILNWSAATTTFLQGSSDGTEIVSCNTSNYRYTITCINAANTTTADKHFSVSVKGKTGGQDIFLVKDGLLTGSTSPFGAGQWTWESAIPLYKGGDLTAFTTADSSSIDFLVFGYTEQITT